MEQIQINCSFPTAATLYMAYMPFLIGGGLFVRTNQMIPLGSLVKLHVGLLSEPDPYQIEAKVVWITPRACQGSKPTGLGMQFIGENRRHFSNKIETCLAGMLKSAQMTDTM